jgi:hypothetical protein
MKPPTALAETARLSRRAALAVGIGVAASGCAAGMPFRSERTPAAEAIPDLAPDVGVAVRAAALVQGAQEVVTSTGQQHPALAPRLADLLVVHRTHLAALAKAVPDGVDVTSGSSAAHQVPARPAAALSSLVTTETALHDGLVGFALQAESGPFARLLGSMAAAVSQQLHQVAP